MPSSAPELLDDPAGASAGEGVGASPDAHRQGSEGAAQASGKQVARGKRLADFFGGTELIIVILLGIVSVVTAYASFQAALYDSQMAGAYTKGQQEGTAAESLYLEANQQYILDVQNWSQLTLLAIDAESSDPQIAQSASEKYDTLYFQSVGEELDAAISWSASENESDPATYTSPFDSEDYMDALFSPYAESKASADTLIAEGDEYNSLSDKLTLNTVLMAISLFLLGVAAVVRSRRSQLVLAGVATAVFIAAAVMTAAIPFVSI